MVTISRTPMDSKNEEAAVLTPQDLQPQLVLRTFFRGRKSCGLHQVVCVLLPLLFYLHLLFFIFQHPTLT